MSMDSSVKKVMDLMPAQTSMKRTHFDCHAHQDPQKAQAPFCENCI
jgi:hypothetical protein